MRIFFLLSVALLSTRTVNSSPNRDTANNEVRCLTILKPQPDPSEATDGAANINEICSAQTGVSEQVNGSPGEEVVIMITEEMKDRHTNCALEVAMMERGLLDHSRNVDITAAQEFVSTAFSDSASDLAGFMREQVPICVSDSKEHMFPILQYNDCLINSCKQALQ